MKKVDNALELIGIAMRKGIEGLETLFFNLKVLNMLVYTCDVDISLTKFDSLTDLEKFTLLLNGANAENVVTFIKVRDSYFWPVLTFPGTWKSIIRSSFLYK